jgi:thiol-disulfide isomerase/thioredoxin
MLTLLVAAALAQSPAPPPPGARQPEMIPIEALDLLHKPAPGFELKTLDGGSFKLQDHKGKTVVLSFWASWCGPCRKELPELAKLQKTRSDVEIFAVNVDRDKALAQKFLATTPVELPIIWDQDSIALGQYEVLSMPTLFVIDKNQVVTFRKTGFSEERGLTELIAVLDGKPLPPPPVPGPPGAPAGAPGIRPAAPAEPGAKK